MIVPRNGRRAGVLAGRTGPGLQRGGDGPLDLPVRRRHGHAPRPAAARAPGVGRATGVLAGRQDARLGQRETRPSASGTSATRPTASPSAGRCGDKEIWRLALLPDGKTLVSGAKYGRVGNWDSSNARQEPAEHLHFPARAWSFEPAGAALVSVDPEGRVEQRLGQDLRARTILELGGHADEAWSARGRWLRALWRPAVQLRPRDEGDGCLGAVDRIFATRSRLHRKAIGWPGKPVHRSRMGPAHGAELPSWQRPAE